MVLQDLSRLALETVRYRDIHMENQVNYSERMELMLCVVDAPIGFPKVFDGSLDGYVHQLAIVAARTCANGWPGAFPLER